MNQHEAFLTACTASSSAAYDQFETLLARLDDPETRDEARRLLTAIEAEQGDEETAFERVHFAIRSLPLGTTLEQRAGLKLLYFKSVFAPEAWSRTFFEGLCRIPASELDGRRLVELGCGNGWISLALAARQPAPDYVVGLDINPRAVLCARINLYLNALDDDGELRTDRTGTSLLDRVAFYESDLLEWARDRNQVFDKVIGCIPQVLDPDLDTLLEISDQASDDFLVALSNYAGRQGYLEDQFGLGLVARAVEESIGALRPGGEVIFNLGGRPGRAILTHLLHRRGFAVEDLWTVRIPQAADTDIGQLADIERHSPHRFEFFLGPMSKESVSARTAQAYVEADGEIFHALTVFRGRFRFWEQIRALHDHLDSLEGAAWREAKNTLDLAYDDEAVATEKAAFLVRVADLMSQRSAFPYGETAGTEGLRRHFAAFLRQYFSIPVADDSLLALPNRATAIRNLFQLFAPSLALVDRQLLGDARLAGANILECPARVDLVCKLMTRLRPALVVMRLDEVDARTPDPFLRLTQAAEEIGALLVIDLSAVVELSSQPTHNGVFQALSETPLPRRVALLLGLIKNQVYNDLQMAFLMTENRALFGALINMAATTYSRVPILTQAYYETLIAELVAFRLDRDATPPSGRASTEMPLPLAAACATAFAHPALAAEHVATDAETIRLDYGENELPSPTVVPVSLFEAFARRLLPESDADPSREIAVFLRQRFGIGGKPRDRRRIVLGLGVSPLFAALAEACAKERGTFVFPTGAYGYFVATVQTFGGRWLEVPTRRVEGFKITPVELDAALAGVDRPWVYLNGPVVNPTGSLYGHDEIAELLAVASKHRARVVLDVLFSGLEHHGRVSWDLDTVLASHALDLVVLGGVSKELAAGGLRFGFAWCHSQALEDVLAANPAGEPHITTRHAARRIFATVNQPDALLRRELAHQRQTLAERAERLTAVLDACGWQTLPSQGGLFLVARPSAYLGRTIDIDGTTVVLDSETISDAMARTVNLLINNSKWTGIPEHCRFVLSVEEEVFEAGLQRIRAFHELVAQRP
ncbi:MAG: aminotransferase class I/II-fold pyridoxal phosphate-dependent enzyme [Acidobacteriota bacterium]